MRRAVIHREHVLQRAVVAFCKRCIAVPHEFASHDRAAPRSANDHIFQAQRGIRAGWPDTELLLDGGRTLRVELKAPKAQLDEESRQADVLVRLNDLGHQAAWANSVTSFGQTCERFSVPLTGNWRTVAQLLDEHVAAKIREAQRRSPAPKPKTEAPMLKMVAKVEAAASAVNEAEAEHRQQEEMLELWQPRSRRRGRPTTAQIRKAEAGRHLP